jgi:hypothetical protein
MTAELVDWLRARLAEDERLAHEAMRGDGHWEYRDRSDDPDLYPWTVYAPDVRLNAGTGFAPQEALHIAEHDPARVLREVEAKRAVVDRYLKTLADRRLHPGDPALAGALLAWLHAVKLIARPFRHRPGWREEWAL